VSVDPVPFEQLVEELVSSFSSAADLPAEHVCTADCTHLAAGRESRRSLLARLEDLVEPGTAPGERGARPSHGVKAGSPAPWDPVAAPLIDEILHGALDLAETTRKVLKFPPLTIRYWVVPPTVAAAVGPTCEACRHRSCVRMREERRPRPGHVDVPASKAPLDDAGRRALRDLLVTRALLPEGHWLVRGELVSKRHKARGYRLGWIDLRLRGWHRRAQLVTGHVQPPVVLRQMVNPVEVRDDVRHTGVFHGPRCAELFCRSHGSCREVGRVGWVKWVTKGRREIEGPICWTCSHPSCVRISYSRLGKWVTVRCPHCGAAGLPQDPVTLVLFCPRPSCVDVDGGRHEWAPSALRTLGLDPIDEPTSRLRYSTETERPAS
jgi:hypothetical protein